MRRVEMIDSSGISALLLTSHRAIRNGGTLTVVCEPGRVFAALQLAGLLETLNVVDSPRAGRELLGRSAGPYRTVGLRVNR